MKQISPEIKKLIIAIGGPTAVGKTEASIKVAQDLGTEIISADSRQLYKEMNIGTAKPSKEQLSMVRHHFIDHLSINELYSVGKYEEDCLNVIETLFTKFDHIVMTGGTGLYFNAIFKGLDAYPQVPEGMLTIIEQKYRQEGIEYLQKYLEKHDPEYFRKVDIYNPHRLLRAVSVIEASGKPFSSFQGKRKNSRDFEIIRILLDIPRQELYDRINSRVLLMMEEGLLAEAKSLYSFRTLRALNTVGYKELFQYLDGDMSLDDAISLIQRNSRRYAKRQLTWFSNQGNWKRFNPEAVDEMLKYIRSIQIERSN